MVESDETERVYREMVESDETERVYRELVESDETERVYRELVESDETERVYRDLGIKRTNRDGNGPLNDDQWTLVQNPHRASFKGDGMIKDGLV
jgi:hypothetical protein